MSTPLLLCREVRLEPLAPAHMQALRTVATDPGIWQYMPLRMATTDDVDAWVAEGVRLNETSGAQVWAICLPDGTVIGSTRLADIHPVHRTAEIGTTWLAKQYRGTGINPRVKLLQLRHAFETLALRRVAFKTHHANTASQRALLKLGAQYEGTFRNHMVMPDGSTRHTLWYSIVAEDWPAIEQRLLERLRREPAAAAYVPDVQSEHG